AVPVVADSVYFLSLLLRTLELNGVANLFFFFFSSRRRHTRLQGDWSSDVCSSDLSDPASRPDQTMASADRRPLFPSLSRPGSSRSEERRVGKECRSRWSRYH